MTKKNVNILNKNNNVIRKTQMLVFNCTKAASEFFSHTQKICTGNRLSLTLLRHVSCGEKSDDIAFLNSFETNLKANFRYSVDNIATPQNRSD